MSKGKLLACRIIFCCLLIHQGQFVFSTNDCAPPKIIHVSEGDDATLQLERSPFTNVLWNFEKHLIATTKPGLALQLEEYSSGYTGRLSSLNDGSLRIVQFSLEDERVYRVELYTQNWEWICVQLYDLRIRGNFRQPPSIAESAETCGPTIQLYHNLRDDVTLQLPGRSNIGFALWDINNIDHIAVTELNGDRASLALRNTSYNGRLLSERDGSLTLLRVTTRDDRVYRADLFEGNFNHLCVQLFDIRVEVVFPFEVCGSPKRINVNEGDDVTLQLERSQFSSVLWNFEKHLIATTKPGLALQLEEHSSEYNGRLSSLNDGSLIIASFSPKDERVYRVELYTRNWEWICVQLYDLRIRGNFRQPPSIAESAETCGPTIQLYHNLRDDVTLQLPGRSNIGFGLWDINNIDHIALTRITGEGVSLALTNTSYSGRLLSEGDGSLKLLRVTAGDGRVYRADLFENNFNHLCMQLFDVGVKTKRT